MLTYNTNSKTGPVCGGRSFVLIIATLLNIYLFSSEKNDDVITRVEYLTVKSIIPLKSLANNEKENLGLLDRNYAVNKGNAIEIKSADGKTVKSIILPRPSFYNNNDTISPKEDKVVSLTMDKSNKTTHLVINDINGFDNTIDFIDKEQLTDTWAPHWSPNGNYLCYKGRDIQGLSALYMDNIINNTSMKISQHGSIPVWSNDSNYLFYLVAGDQKSNILDLYRINLKTFEKKRITENSRVSLNVVPNHNGSKVVFVASHLEPGLGLKMVDKKNDNSALILFDLITDDFVEIYHGERSLLGKSSVSWSPDNSKFVFCKNDEFYQGTESGWERVISNSEIYISSLDGKSIKKITNTPNIIEKDTKWLSNSILSFHTKSDEFILELIEENH